IDFGGDDRNAQIECLEGGRMKLAEFREGVPGAEAKPGRAPGMIDGGPVQRLEVVDRRAGGGEEGHGLGLGVIGAKRFRDRKSTRLNSSHYCATRMPYSA